MTARLETPTGALFGTLVVPSGAGAYPVAFIIAGSGPTDRDGNQPSLTNNSLALLAAGLGAHGIATLRTDKRGVGESRVTGMREEDLRFTDYVHDAEGWIDWLRQDARFSSITVIGHSEGSLIGMIAAREARADRFVSIAGAGRPAQAILRDQLHDNLPAWLQPEADSELDAIVAGRRVENVPAPLAALFRPSVQPYLMSWFAFDPAREIGRLTIPVLVACGTSDIQVAPSEAQLLAQAAPNARQLTVPDMNHVLKVVPAGDIELQGRSYTDPTLPVAPALIDGVAAFIR